MSEKLTNQQLATHYVSLNNAWKAYIEQGLFDSKIEVTIDDILYRIGPFKIGIPKKEKDPEGKDIIRTGETLRYINLIDDYNKMFGINKAIYQYIKKFITFCNEHALPEYE